MKNDEKLFNRILAFIGYIIPLIGWMLPLYFQPKNEVMQYHGKQGFLFTVATLVNAVFYYLITRLIPIQYSNLEIALWILLGGSYVIFSLFFAFKALTSKKADMPFFAGLAQKLPL